MYAACCQVGVRQRVRYSDYRHRAEDLSAQHGYSRLVRYVSQLYTVHIRKLLLPRNAHANHIRRAVYAVARYLSVCDKYRNGWRLVFLELPSYCRHETFSVMIQIKLSVY